jgi:mannose/fructose/N-acetylgalactosamine-specific phosphotransferase system component IIB
MASPPPHVAFCLVRVDDRLLHGQVVLNWVRTLRPSRIAIVDDALAGDLAARLLLTAAAPRGLDIWVGAVADASAALLADPRLPPSTTMVLVRDPETGRRVFDAGVHFAALSLGALGLTSARVRVGSQVSLSREELEVLRYLASKGVMVSAQALPTDRAIGLRELERRTLRGRRRSD